MKVLSVAELNARIKQTDWSFEDDYDEDMVDEMKRLHKQEVALIKKAARCVMKHKAHEMWLQEFLVNETSMEACFEAIESKCEHFILTQPELKQAVFSLTEAMQEVYGENDMTGVTPNIINLLFIMDENERKVWHRFRTERIIGNDWIDMSHIINASNTTK